MSTFYKQKVTPLYHLNLLYKKVVEWKCERADAAGCEHTECWVYEIGEEI